MLNLIQHLTKSRTYETLKQVQGDKSGLFTRPSNIECLNKGVLPILNLEFLSSEFVQNLACLPCLPTGRRRQGF
jgi:hypothetical protein